MVAMDAERAALERLAERLWDERRIVTLLLYRLTVSRLLLAADERRFAPEALREVDQAVELLREGELERDLALRDLAEVWQVSPEGLLLPELVARAPEPYAMSFRDHLDAFQQLAEEIDAVTAENRTLANTQLDHVSDSIDALTGVPRERNVTYDAQGRLEGAGAVGGRLRRAL